MPSYEYRCGECGPFKAWRPMAESDLPSACPVCTEPSPRLISAPNLGAASVGAAPAAAGSSMRIHSGGCACCAPRSSPRVAAPA